MLQQQSWISLQTLTATGWLKCAALAYVSSFKICKCASSDKALPILIIENYLTCLNMVLTLLSEPIGGFLVWTVHCHTLTSLPERRFLLETKLLQQQSQISLQTLTASGGLLANVSSFKICKCASSDKGLPILYYDWKLLDKKTNKRLHQLSINSFFCWNSLDLHLSQTLNTDTLGSVCFCFDFKCPIVHQLLFESLTQLMFDEHSKRLV